MRYSELKKKEVVNVLDGQRMGCATDFEFDPATGCISAIIVPGPFSLINFIKGTGGYVIPWGKICKIGDDVVLVELDAGYFRAYDG